VNPRPDGQNEGAQMQQAPLGTIVIFGASGDLAFRKLAPAIHSLTCAGQLHPDTQVLGVGRSDIANDAFRERIAEGVSRYARLKPGSRLCEMWPRFKERFSYFQMAIDRPDEYLLLAEKLRGSEQTDISRSLLFYVATPPDGVPSIIHGLQHAGLASPTKSTRIILEKPFGRDLESSRNLNEITHEAFEESQIYRIDHYLGKETVQNLLAFRFANAIFEPVWNRDYVDHVQVTVAESIGVEHRAGYYDASGAIRDIVQNHMLQLVALIAMDSPVSSAPDALRDAKMRVLKSIQPARPSQVRTGQYIGYRSESGVADNSQTPTFAALRLDVRNERWEGVPFYLRTGKRLPKKSTEITIQFRQMVSNLFGSGSLEPNRISLRIQPDEGARLRFQMKVPGAGMTVRSADLAFDYEADFGADALPDAYERLIVDALCGDPSLFIRCDEIERCWEIVEDVLELREPPQPYVPESWGPSRAQELFEDSGRQWLCACVEEGQA